MMDCLTAPAICPAAPDGMGGGGQLRGLRYLNEKEPHGGDRGNQYTKEARDQNDPLAKTAKKIADQTGVSEMTIKRDAQFAQAIDLIQKDTPKLAQKILKEEIKPTPAAGQPKNRHQQNLVTMTKLTPKWDSTKIKSPK